MKRNDYFDFLRGIAILMVVAIHTYNMDTDGIVIRQLLNTAVPIFIAISGYFLSLKVTDTKGEYINFLKKQLSKVYYPVLLWSLPLLAISIIQGKSILANIILFFVCGMSIYYFVAFIMQCYVVLPLVKKLVYRIKWEVVILASLISTAWIAIVMYYINPQGIHLPLIVYAGLLPCWLVFFVLGTTIALLTKRKYSLWIPLLITIVGFGCSIVESNYLTGHYGIGVGIKPSSFLFSIGVILLLFPEVIEKKVAKCGWRYRGLLKLGKMSFTIYLCHCYFLYIFNIIHVDNWLVKFIIILTISTLFVVTLKWAVPKSMFKYLGL